MAYGGISCKYLFCRGSMLYRTYILLFFFVSIFSCVHADDATERVFREAQHHIGEDEFVSFLRTFCKKYQELHPDEIKETDKKYQRALNLDIKSDELKQIVLDECNCHTNEAMYQQYARDMLEQALHHHQHELRCAYQQMVSVIHKMRDLPTKEIQALTEYEDAIDDYEAIVKETSNDVKHAKNELAGILARAQLRFTLRQQALRYAYHRHAIRCIRYVISELNDSDWSFFNPLGWLFS